MMNRQGCFGIPRHSKEVSEIWVCTPTGVGSSSNWTPTWGAILSQIGSSIEYRKSAVLGDAFYARDEGIYAITYNYSPDTAGDYGILYNADVSASSQQNGVFLAIQHQATASSPIAITVIKYLYAGDYVKPTGVPGALYSDTNSIKSSFRITKIG